jgi:hypothetical protein
VLDLDERGRIGLPFQPQFETVAVDAQDGKCLDVEVRELHVGVEFFVERVDQLLPQQIGVRQRENGDPQPRQHPEDDANAPPDELQVPLDHNFSLLQPLGHGSAARQLRPQMAISRHFP